MLLWRDKTDTCWLGGPLYSLCHHRCNTKKTQTILATRCMSFKGQSIVLWAGHAGIVMRAPHLQTEDLARKNVKGLVKLTEGAPPSSAVRSTTLERRGGVSGSSMGGLAALAAAARAGACAGSSFPSSSSSSSLTII